MFALLDPNLCNESSENPLINFVVKWKLNRTFNKKIWECAREKGKKRKRENKNHHRHCGGFFWYNLLSIAVRLNESWRGDLLLLLLTFFCHQKSLNFILPFSNWFILSIGPCSFPTLFFYFTLLFLLSLPSSAARISIDFHVTLK